jgi:hypothetical protein
LVEAGPQAPGLVGLEARPDVDELVGRVDRAEDALAGARVARLGLDDQDVALGEVREGEAAVDGGRDVEVDADSTSAAMSTNVEEPGAEQVKVTVLVEAKRSPSSRADMSARMSYRSTVISADRRAASSRVRLRRVMGPTV